MLILPKDWSLINGGAVVADLFQQLPDVKAKTVFASHVIGASLEMAIAGIFQDRQPPQLEERISDLTWQIRDCIYTYIPEINNSALEKVIELTSRSHTVTILVPPKHDNVFWRACEFTLKSHTPMIMSLDSYVSLRTLFSSWDLEWPQERIIFDILRRYNRRAIYSHCDDSILVDIPPDFE
jgi:hypothetical protein